MSGSGFQALLEICLYLAILVGLLAGAAFFFRNGFRFFRPNSGENKLQISETRILGNRQFLVVAQYEGKKVLLGVCPNRIDYLCDLGGGQEEPFAAVLQKASE